MDKEIKICLCGIQGYAGHVLARLVEQHPKLTLTGILARKSQAELYAAMPFAMEKHIPVYSLNELQAQQYQFDVLVLATPAAASIEIVTALASTKMTVIDLSGAFRLSQRELKQWYGLEHQLGSYAAGAHYGLSPWNKAACHQLIANPGCYATCALMALIPLLKAGIIANETIVIDAKSGASGAGKNPKPALMFAELSQNFYPYKIGQHQHTPEIVNALQQFTAQSCDISLVTQMLPLQQGIAMSIYAKSLLNDEAMMLAVKAAYEKAYQDYPLATFAAINQGSPQQDHSMLSLKTIVGTAGVNIAYHVQDKKVFVFATIDNLYKGAASQAIENINHLYQFPIDMGLTLKGGMS